MSIKSYLSIFIVICGIDNAYGTHHKYHKPTKTISILSYGSLVHWPEHSITHARLEATKFSPTHIRFPIGYSLLPNKERITAIIDNQEGDPKTIWAAISYFKTVSQAIQNLAAREGAPWLSHQALYDTSHIYYLKKECAGYILAAQEKRIDNSCWIIKEQSNIRQTLPHESIIKITEWANSHQYDAVIWASCPVITLDRSELIRLLLTNKKLLEQAQHYIKHLPEGPQTVFEKAIYAGKEELLKLLKK